MPDPRISVLQDYFPALDNEEAAGILTVLDAAAAPAPERQPSPIEEALHWCRLHDDGEVNAAKAIRRIEEILARAALSRSTGARASQGDQ